jgi:Adenylate cyclase associated (CAP) C terminal
LAEVQAKALSIGETFKHVEKNSHKKNPAALPEVPQKKAPVPAQAAPKAPEVKKEPTKEMKFNTTYLQNYGKEVLKFDNEDEVSPSYGFVLINCKDTQVVIVGKCKSIMLEACTNVKIVFDSVVTAAEIINCKKITFTIKEQ